MMKARGCPILKIAGIDEANSGAGISICTKCPLPHCIYNNKAIHINGKDLVGFINFLIDIIREHYEHQGR